MEIVFVKEYCWFLCDFGIYQLLVYLWLWWVICNVIEYCDIEFGYVLLSECDLVCVLVLLCVIVCKVIVGLVEEGLLIQCYGVGMFVVECIIKLMLCLISFIEDLCVCGFNLCLEFFECGIGEVMLEELMVMNLLFGVVVVCLYCVCYVGDELLVIECSVVLVILLFDFMLVDDLFYEVLEKCGCCFCCVLQWLCVVLFNV